MTRSKKVLVVLVFILLTVVLVFLVGKSFGFFQYLKKGESVNIISIGGIDTEILSDNNALNLENSYPISDEEGVKLTPFVFNMTNNSSKNLSYTMKIEIDSDKLNDCTLSDGSSCSSISTDYIKFVYKKNDGSYTDPANLASSDNIITSDVIYSKDTVTSSIILWIDSSAGNEIMNKYFYGKLIITGEEYVSEVGNN